MLDDMDGDRSTDCASTSTLRPMNLVRRLRGGSTDYELYEDCAKKAAKAALEAALHASEAVRRSAHYVKTAMSGRILVLADGKYGYYNQKSRRFVKSQFPGLSGRPPGAVRQRRTGLRDMRPSSQTVGEGCLGGS